MDRVQTGGMEGELGQPEYAHIQTALIDRLTAPDTSDSIIALEGHVPAAVQWIIVCGQRLHDECSDAQSKWPEWETNLDWIVGQAGLYDSVKSLCQQALVEMRRIDNT